MSKKIEIDFEFLKAIRSAYMRSMQLAYSSPFFHPNKKDIEEDSKFMTKLRDLIDEAEKKTSDAVADTVKDTAASNFVTREEFLELKDSVKKIEGVLVKWGLLNPNK